MKIQKFLLVEDIEYEAMKLLGDYSAKIEPITGPAVPVDEIFEIYLQFDFRFADLSKKYGDSNVLAEIFIKNKKVVVDTSLEPDTHPDMLGRYNFTLAHEIGHWVLHRDEVFAVSNEPDLFGLTANPVICRDGSHEPREWQANTFAANLLMPKEWVIREWLKIFPDGSPLNIKDEMERKADYMRRQGKQYEPTSDVARDMRTIFKVSAQAMHRRLNELGMLELGVHQPTLFEFFNTTH